MLFGTSYRPLQIKIQYQKTASSRYPVHNTAIHHITIIPRNLTPFYKAVRAYSHVANLYPTADRITDFKIDSRIFEEFGRESSTCAEWPTFLGTSVVGCDWRGQRRLKRLVGTSAVDRRGRRTLRPVTGASGGGCN